MTQEQQAKAEAALAANPSIGRRRLMAACGCTAFAAATYLRTAGTIAPAAAKSNRTAGATAPAAAKSDRPGVSVRDFSARFDFEAKLRKTLKELCQDKFVSDLDIRNHCDIPVTSFRTVATLPEFTACQMKDSGTVWWSVKENVDSVRAKARKWGVSR
jgi:hypothetical protein